MGGMSLMSHGGFEKINVPSDYFCNNFIVFEFVAMSHGNFKKESHVFLACRQALCRIHVDFKKQQCDI